MKRKRNNGVFIALLITMFLTGCWDLVEIDARGLIAAIALDKKSEDIALTYSVPNLSVVTGQGGEGEINFIKKTTGKTLLEANKNFNKISNQKLTFEHNQAIVFGDAFLGDSEMLKSALDYFDRSPDYAKSITVVATDKTGEALLESKPNSPDPIGGYIHSLFQPSNGKVISSEKVSLNTFISTLYDTGGNGQLPKIIYKDQEVQMDGIILLKDYKKHYSLSSEQLKPFNWVKGNGADTFVQVDFKQVKTSYEISQFTRQIKISDTKNGLVIKIKVATEGDIDEYILEQGKNIFKNQIVKELEESIKEEMEEQMNEMVRLMQTEVGFDVFNISSKIKLQNGKLWEKIKDDWDAYFSSAKISVEVDPHIRRIGMSK